MGALKKEEDDGMAETVVGLMGLGRIGRNLVRILHHRDDIRVGAISDPADHAGLEYLLRYDTILGRFPASVSLRDGNLYVAGRQIRMLSAENPGEVQWGELGVDVVIEATGKHRSRQELERHLQAGAKRVILCAPPLDPPDITVVMGVNDDRLRPEHRIVSNASVTAHAAAPILKILHRAFGVQRAFLSAIHAYTNQLRLADVPAEDMRTGRAAAENIIPQPSHVAGMLMELMPELGGRIDGMALNVPVPNGSVVDLVCWHERPVSIAAINEVMRTAAGSGEWDGIIAYEDGPIVSADTKLSRYSGTFDSLATMVIGDRLSKTLCWYDNGWGYAHRALDLIHRFAELERRAA
ncbi:MAG TPA: glyceraldehyde 3-phosphate dehydrogenase NAD-binding domain-containing protein [Thermoanaerobaculia bacterium]|nr:glyceraldehyde 3-phosphate dehydrogenase NAD-binding domain-containing protein [Thermoanaerobaculia bacterium]